MQPQTLLQASRGSRPRAGRETHLLFPSDHRTLPLPVPAYITELELKGASERRSNCPLIKKLVKQIAFTFFKLLEALYFLCDTYLCMLIVGSLEKYREA